MKIYSESLNVLEAGRQRMSMLFDNFEDIVVSVSGGKDSTVLFYLALQEAIKRDRKIHCFFLDQEAEYASTIDIIKICMTQKNVIPQWFQVPIYLTNATSLTDYFLYAWGENEKWMREKNPLAIHTIDEEYPKRFYEFFPWHESKKPNAAYLVGIRAEEGVIRFRAVTKYEGWNKLKWSTTTNDIHKFYPIYDWTVYDVWKFIYDFNLPYNKVYDKMFWNNVSIYNKMRVSNLIHEKSYKCLGDLAKYEVDTYNKLTQRIGGISTASRYSKENLVFSNKTLPKHFSKWKDFRDFLLESFPNEEQKKIFIKRFEKQENTEDVYQKQVGQLLINDYENSKSFDTKKSERDKKEVEKWKRIL